MPYAFYFAQNGLTKSVLLQTRWVRFCELITTYFCPTLNLAQQQQQQHCNYANFATNGWLLNQASEHDMCSR